MLEITIPGQELWDEKHECFVNTKGATLKLEHSLVSVSKWESKWHKPFLSDGKKTVEETIDYIRCMTITQNVDPNVYNFITNDVIEKVTKYIDDPMTATWFSDNGKNKGGQKEIVTAEVVYYWMFAQNIPMECQKWHFNKLMTLIRVCNEKNKPPEKKSKAQIAREYAALNAARRKATKARKEAAAKGKTP